MRATRPAVQAFHDAGELCAGLRQIAVANSLDHQLAQRAAVELQLAQHIEDLPAERRARFLELFQQAAIDIALAGFLGHEVPQVAHFGLTDAVDAAEALFEAVGVPGQVVVDHQVRALEVDAFAGGIGGEQDLHIRVVPEAFLRLAALFAAHATVDQHHRLRPTEQRADLAFEVVERVAVLGEEHELLAS